MNNLSFLKSAFSGANGNASSLRIFLLLIVLTICFFVLTASKVMWLTNNCPEIPTGMLAFLTLLPTVMGALIRWGDAQNKPTDSTSAPSTTTPPAP